jgi:hypothetical protein
MDRDILASLWGRQNHAETLGMFDMEGATCCLQRFLTEDENLIPFRLPTPLFLMIIACLLNLHQISCPKKYRVNETDFNPFDFLTLISAHASSCIYF